MAVARRLPILSGMYPGMPISRLFRLYNCRGGRENREEHSVSSHSVHTQSNSVLHDGSRTLVRLQGGAATTIFDQAMVTAVVSVIAYIAAIMIGWL
jgi:hypothetical protein